MSGKLLNMVFCILLAAVPAAVLLGSVGGGAGNHDIAVESPAAGFEAFVGAGIPFKDKLAEFGRELKLMGGQREINGIFVSSGGLMRNLLPPNEEMVDANIKGVGAFADWARTYHKPAYIMLIPTAAGIMHQNLPPFARDASVNQREFIDSVYIKASNSASYIDAYSALLDQRGKYIYYRTEDNLTSLGGYYVYSAMLSRLLNTKASLQEFDIEYTGYYFYGGLYAESGYKDVGPDNISIFRYSMSNRQRHEYTVLHKGGDEKMYHTLFPKHAPVFGDQMSVFLGGLSAVTDIQSSSGKTSRILVFGDKTAVSYLPFLANNAKRVTFIDLERYNPSDNDASPENYDQIIFAYGVDTFMHTSIPSKAGELVED